MSPLLIPKIKKMGKEEEHDQPFPHYAKFLVGGIAGVTAALCVHPMDFLKTRMQLAGTGDWRLPYKNFTDAAIKIVKAEGLLALYDGATACAARHAIYTTTRLGLYTTLFTKINSEDKHPSFAQKASIGLLSGAGGIVFAIPLGVCVVRMMADGGKPPEHRLNYRHVFNALYRIGREENGLYGLYRGGLSAFLRAIVVNGSMLATYSQAKEAITSYGLQDEGFGLHFSASVISGFATSVTSCPVDVIKTRIQAQKSGEPKLRIRQVFWTILTNEGPRAFWKGLTPYFIRLAPITTLTFIYVEQLTYWFHIYILGNKHPRSNL